MGQAEYTNESESSLSMRNWTMVLVVANCDIFNAPF